MNTNKIYDELEIIILVSQGDEPAFGKIFKHYQNKIYGVALRLTRSAALSEEIVEDVFLKIWLKRSSLLQIQNFSAYLFTITRNCVYKSLKQIAKNYQPVHLTENIQFISPDTTEDYIIG